MYPGDFASSTPDVAAQVMATTGEVTTYAEFDAAANRLSQLFASAGLAPGDHIAFSLENHPRFFEVAWGAHYAGLRYTAASSRLTAGELEYIVNDCGALAFLTSYYRAEPAGQILDTTPEVRLRLMLDGVIDGYPSYEEAVARFPAEPLPDRREGSDMLYSSGTTGRPKGVKTPVPDVPLGTDPPLVLLVKALFGFEQDMTYLSPAPLYHAAPLRFNMCVHRIGGTSVIMEHFEAEQFLAFIERYRVTHTQVVPTMFIRILKLPEEVRNRYDLSSLQSVVHAAAPCPVAVKEEMIRWWGPIIHEYYAGTEGNGFCYVDSSDWMTHKGTVGRPLYGILHIVGDDGEEAPVGEAGTIYFEAGGVFEYYNDPEKTAESRDGHGWSTLDDVGYVDEDGFLYLTDRKAFMIISGGVNIYPQEAENVLVTHPAVLDAAVFGVPNVEFGEEVKAVVQPADPAAAGADLERELIAFCRSQLADVKCPRSIDFREELPRQPTGKLYKRLLKDEYWADHGRSRII